MIKSSFDGLIELCALLKASLSGANEFYVCTEPGRPCQGSNLPVMELNRTRAQPGILTPIIKGSIQFLPSADCSGPCPCRIPCDFVGMWVLLGRVFPGQSEWLKREDASAFIGSKLVSIIPRDEFLSSCN